MSNPFSTNATSSTSSASASVRLQRNLPAPDAATAAASAPRPAFTRTEAGIAAGDRMVGTGGVQAGPGFIGRDPVARAALESACQRLSTKMTEGTDDEAPMHNIAFLHGAQQGHAGYNPLTEPVISVRLGGLPRVLAISSLANISYLGKPIAQLKSAELQEATRLANAVIASSASNYTRL